MRYRIEQKIETLASHAPPAGQRPRAVWMRCGPPVASPLGRWAPAPTWRCASRPGVRKPHRWARA